MTEYLNIVLGTAGHVDHGKSTLIEALTGIKMDTTKEESRRGLSINLGFAYLTLPNGQEIGVIDVPGHEKFLKNMLAGAPGLDLVLLVIDVNEGIMPQTIEHASILRLLGVENFIIVLTKVSGADEVLKEIVREDIRDQFTDSALMNAPIIETDAIDGIGLDTLRETIQARCQKIQSNHHDLPARINVDRSFSVKGFGTVVTGTLIDGTVRVGDEICIYPGNTQTKIRSIQKHNQQTEVAYAGNRTALNLTKVSLEDVKRGDILSAVPLTSSYMLDVKVECVSESPFSLELWDRVHVYIGTQEVRARIVPIGCESIQPGEQGYLQLRLEQKVFAKKGDHFILRSYSPMYTIAGGIILDENPTKHKRFDETVIQDFEIKETGDLGKILLNYMSHLSYMLISEKDMAHYLNIERSEVSEIINELIHDESLIAIGHQYISHELLQQFKKELVEVLQNYHETYPIRQGMPLEELRSKFNKMSPKDRDSLFKLFSENGVVELSTNSAKLPVFDAELDTNKLKLKNEIEEIWKTAAFNPPNVDDVTQGDKVKEEIVRMMIGHELFRLDKNTYIHTDLYEHGVENAVKFIKEHGKITLAEFRDMMDTSRKYGIKMLEHLDDIGVTKRIDDYRVLNDETSA